MSIPYFIWKGFDCRNLGIMVETYPPMVKPKERVEQVAIPGLSGKLVIPEPEETPEAAEETAQPEG